jgi:hypothetical protein
MQMLHRDLMHFGSEEMRGLLPAAVKQLPSLFATLLEEGIAAGEVRPLDPQRAGVLLLGMINALTAPRMFGDVARPLSEDVDLAVETLFEGIGTQS